MLHILFSSYYYYYQYYYDLGFWFEFLRFTESIWRFISVLLLMPFTIQCCLLQTIFSIIFTKAIQSSYCSHTEAQKAIYDYLVAADVVVVVALVFIVIVCCSAIVKRYTSSDNYRQIFLFYENALPFIRILYGWCIYCWLVFIKCVSPTISS